jgi:hypothetical protein
MLTATVHCDRCNIDLESVSADSWPELAHLLGGLLVTQHAAIPHTSHALSMQYTGEPVGSTVRRPLIVECLHEHCGAPKRSAWDAVPVELVGAYVICFHTAHEGHRLRVRYGAREFGSPPPVHPEDDA